MSDIFISYARSTEGQATKIADALRGLGYGVWRDDELPAHRAYADVIRERLQASKAVVVVWSAEAARSARRPKGPRPCTAPRRPAFPDDGGLGPGAARQSEKLAYSIAG